MTFAPPILFDLAQTHHAALFSRLERAWEALPRIAPYLREHLQPAFHGKKIGESYIGPQVYIGPGTVIEPGAVIKGPAWIGADCEIRAGAYLRENVIAGDGCVLGNSCEFKNAVLFNGCNVPHFAYVGDSILGYKAHLGAGVILSNVKLAKDEVVLNVEGQRIPTGLRKFGALIGDGVEVGCKAVLNPGTILGRGSILYPGVVWGGVLPAKTLVKSRPQYQLLPVRD